NGAGAIRRQWLAGAGTAVGQRCGWAGEEGLELQIGIIVSDFPAFKPVSGVSAHARAELVFHFKSVDSSELLEKLIEHVHHNVGTGTCVVLWTGSRSKGRRTSRGSKAIGRRQQRGAKAAVGGEIPSGWNTEIVKAERINHMKPVSDVIGDAKVAAVRNTLRRGRAEHVRHSLAGASDKAIENFVERWIFGGCAGIAEATRHIHVLEVVALKAQLLCRIVTANLADARVSESAIK